MSKLNKEVGEPMTPLSLGECLKAMMPFAMGIALNLKNGPCVLECFIDAALGTAKSEPFKQLGDIALKKAMKKGLSTGIVKIGAHLIPGLSALSTAATTGQFIYCFFECNCE